MDHFQYGDINILSTRLLQQRSTDKKVYADILTKDSRKKYE